MHTYEDLIAGEPTEYDWPELDERSAAAMCYTSGTTGDPKGVVYSQRSIYLHSMQVCMSDGPNLAQATARSRWCRSFTRCRWGLPYAAFMIGASLIMPDRFLQPGPLAELIAAERPTFAAAVPTIWQGLHLHLEHHPQDISSMREVLIGGAGAAVADARVRERPPGVGAARVGDDRDVAGRFGRASARRATGEERWKYRYTQGRFPASVEARLIDDDGNRVPPRRHQHR